MKRKSKYRPTVIMQTVGIFYCRKGAARTLPNQMGKYALAALPADLPRKGVLGNHLCQGTIRPGVLEELNYERKSQGFG